MSHNHKAGEREYNFYVLCHCFILFSAFLLLLLYTINKINVNAFRKCVTFGKNAHMLDIISIHHYGERKVFECYSLHVGALFILLYPIPQILFLDSIVCLFSLNISNQTLAKIF